jgi:hypothetical protein
MTSGESVNVRNYENVFKLPYARENSNPKDIRQTLQSIQVPQGPSFELKSQAAEAYKEHQKQNKQFRPIEELTQKHEQQIYLLQRQKELKQEDQSHLH